MTAPDQGMARRAEMDFVLVLHTHLPYVLGHGKWPHGTDWLMEAAVDSYLPIIQAVQDLGRDGITAPVTLSITPVLAAQLAAPAFADELRAFLAQRVAACDEAAREIADHAADAHLAPIVQFWRAWHVARAAQYAALDGGIPGALRSLADSGAIELMSSAATHGFLPLLARDESIQLQLLAGRDEHRRVFGRDANGCWLPECAYRPAGMWAPRPGVAPRHRAGIESHLEGAGFRFVVIDSHLALAGEPLTAYARTRVGGGTSNAQSPYASYSIGDSPHGVRALVRDPESTRQVWSRQEGYPGGGAYLEFHKIRFPGGLQLWSVTGLDTGLDGKQPYDAERARALAGEHARHYTSLIEGISHRAREVPGGGIIAPFDTELFGHWWFEGSQFLAETYRALHQSRSVRAVTATEHLERTNDAIPIDLPAGSWGRDGDFSYWLNDRTAWMWERLWALEERFWSIAPAALALEHRSARPVLAQAAREFLLTQASDWQFMITAGEVADYGERRFRLHADATDALLGSLEAEIAGVGDLVGAARHAAELHSRDDLFPNVLDAVERAAARVAALA